MKSSKLKNIIILLLSIIAIIISITYGGKIYAASTSITDLFKLEKPESKLGTWITYGGSIENKSYLYCVYKGQGHGQKVRLLKRVVYIDGKKATVKYIGADGEIKSREVTDESNAILAHILTTKGGYGSGAGAYTSSQYAVYSQFNEWARKVLNGSFVRSNNDYAGSTEASDKIVDAAEAYADTITKDNKLKEEGKVKAAKTDVKVSTDGEWIKIGPFEWTFEKLITNINLYDQDKKVIDKSNYKFTNAKGEEKPINSGNKFYIYLKKSAKVKKITNITITQNYEWVTGIVYILGNSSTQTYLAEEVDKKNEPVETTFEVNIDLIIALSGYVWEEGGYGKTLNTYNNLFKDNQYDIYDTLVEGVTVRIVYYNDNGEKKILKSAKTDKNGKYKFEDILIAELKKYYIEFVYDGHVYNAIPYNLKKANGSKVAEFSSERTALNNAFSYISGTGDVAKATQGYSRDANGKITGAISYDKSQEYKAMNADSKRDNSLRASTQVTKYKLDEVYEQVEGDIENINLGIRKRELPKMSINNDLDTVKITINGYDNTYYYSQKNFDKAQGVNIGVKFESIFTGKYMRAVYPSDVQYTNTKEPDKELKMYITYKTRVVNSSSNLTMYAREIADYIGTNYEVEKVYRLDADGKTQKDIAWSTTGTYGQTYNQGGYKAIYITGLTDPIPSLNKGNNYVEFYTTLKLDRLDVLSCLSGNAPIDNVVEINSYSTYDSSGKNVYGTIDYESAPGNAIPGKVETYEADTDQSTSLQLELYGAREIKGTIFVDESEFDKGNATDLHPNVVREGNGIYDKEEKTLANVPVRMVEVNDDGTVKTGGQVYEVDENQNKITTDSEGNYSIKGYVPGKYRIEYTWGDTTYTVQDYKATVYKEKDRQSDNNWYKHAYETNKNANGNQVWPTNWKINVEYDNLKNKGNWNVVRYSDAMDDINERLAIDKEIETINANTSPTKTTMTSRTPIMSVGVEYESTLTASTGNRYTYEIENTDFGITERARQDITLEKKVNYLKVTLANGQILFEGNPQDPEAKLPGVKVLPDNKMINIELDSELIHGATLEIGYELIINNNSEKDYVLTETPEQEFYHYGVAQSQPRDSKVVKYNQATIIDFVDNELSIKEGANNQWTKLDITNEEIINGTFMTEEEVKAELAKYNTVVQTEGLAKPGEELTIGPGGNAKTQITLTKVLTNANSLSYENRGEIVQIGKDGGSTLTVKELGGYLVSTEKGIGSDAPKIVITPPTGETRIYYILGITSLAILGTGIVIIRKKVMNK